MCLESNQSMSKDLKLYQAIKDNKIEEIKLLLDDGRNLNDPIVITGPFAGYTALHVACMGENDDLVKLLVKEYKVDVNVVAEDKTQPIHLVCFYEPLVGGFKSSLRKMLFLLAANANAKAEVDKEMFSKHVKDCEWCPDFGNKITLCLYTIISHQEFLTDELAFAGADLEVKSLSNKTLAMFVIENGISYSLGSVIDSVNSEYLNHRDNDGIPATHYAFHPKMYGNYRYDSSQQFDEMRNNRHSMVDLLFGRGADKYALLNDDPATFLPNMAAYRSCPETLFSILPYYTSMSLSKALYFATLPIDWNSDNCIRLDPEDNAKKNRYISNLQEQRQRTIQLILKDLINRITFGLSVPESEKKLMEKLIATDPDIKKFVHNYKANFITGKLKNKFIDVGDKNITLYDFIMDVFNDRKLKVIAIDDDILLKFRLVVWDDFCDDCKWFEFIVAIKCVNAFERLKLLKALKKISSLTDAIPLPYELILDIVKYLNNNEFDIFIKAFISLQSL